MSAAPAAATVRASSALKIGDQKDHGQFGRQLAHGAEQGESVEGGLEKVGDHKVEPAFLDCREEFRARLDAEDFAPHAFGFEGVADHQRVFPPAFEMDDLERSW